MKDTLVSFKGKDKDGNEFAGEVTAILPTTTEEAVTKYGDEVCVSKINQSVIIDLQRVCRAFDGDIAKAQDAVDKFVPGISRGRTSDGTSLSAMAKKMKDLKEADPDKHAELMAMINAAAQS